MLAEMIARRLWTETLLVRRCAVRTCRGPLTPAPFRHWPGWRLSPSPPVHTSAFRPLSLPPSTGVLPQSSSLVPARCLSTKDPRKPGKKKRKAVGQAEERDEDSDPEDSEDEDELEDDRDNDLGLPRGYKDQERVVASLRFDLIIRAGLDMPRNQVDDAFYANKLRLNGQPLVKKSKPVSVGDTLDLVLKDDSDTGTVTLMRVVFKTVSGGTETSEKYRVLLRRWKHLTLPGGGPREQ